MKKSHIIGVHGVFIILALLMLGACGPAQSSNFPPSLEEELFGFRDTSCAPFEQTDTGDSQIVPMSKMNHLLGIANQLILTEDLYTDNSQCDGRYNSPTTITTSIKFSELASLDVPKPCTEISISNYSVKIYAGNFSAALQRSKFCDHDDWLDPFAPIERDITKCMQQQKHPRDQMRWILERSNGKTRLGFFSRDKSFDPTQVEWLDPGDFKKAPNSPN